MANQWGFDQYFNEEMVFESRPLSEFMTVEEGKRLVLEKIEEVKNFKVRKHLLDMALMQYQLAFEELKDVNKQCREAIAR